jgi:GT2 family glycosyltransferase
VRRYNLNPPRMDDLEREAIEQKQIELSDLVIGPSQYLLDWYEADGVALPKARRLDWILPMWVEKESPDRPLATPAVAPCAIRELIFFGRQERRKGIEVFVEAIRQLPADVTPDVTFLGRFDHIYKEFTGSYIARRLADYEGKLRFLNDMDQGSAMDFIRSRPQALCMMPSLIENSPCTVGECFTLGIPFLATDVGGTAELTAPASRRATPLPAQAKELSAAIIGAVRDGLPAAQSSLNPTRIRAAWTKLHEQLCARPSRRTPARSKTGPTVTVCLVHYERPEMLARALDALNAQDYRDFDVVISDDGSRSPEAKAALDRIEADKAYRFPITIVRGENRYLGAARNAAAASATGEYLLFHDDDNLAEPHEISQFVASALASGADILTCQSYIFEGEPSAPGRILYYPIGIGGPFSFYRNRFGDANALFRRSVFEALGGFSEHYGLGWEDWELFLKAHLRGCRMAVVPEALFWYRASSGGMLNAGNPVLNQERLYAMIAAENPKLTQDLLRHAQLEHLGSQEKDRAYYMLGNLPHGQLHRALLTTAPNSPEAQNLFVDLLDAIGRKADADAFADQSPVTRGRRARAGHVAGDLSFAEPREDAVLLDGWWTLPGEAGVPRDIEVGGVRHRVVALRRFPRRDVSRHFGLPEDEDLGFAALAVPRPRGLRALADRFRAKVKIGCDPSLPAADQPAFLVARGRPASGHADKVTRLRRANRIALKETGTIDVSALDAIEAALLSADGLALPSTTISQQHKRFRFGPGEADLYVSAKAAQPSLITY